MSNLLNRLATLQGQLQDLLASMSARDRGLFIGLIVSVVVAVVVISLYTMSSSLSSMSERIDDREYSLQQIRLLIAEYEASHEQAQAIQEGLREHASTDLSAFLDKSAEEVQIGDKLDAVKEKSESNDGVLIEKMYAVSLSNLTETELVNFLHQIETDSFPLQIKSIKIKSRRRGEELTLRVEMDIAAYILSDGSSE